jgi:regulator of sigma E protease
LNTTALFVMLQVTSFSSHLVETEGREVGSATLVSLDGGRILFVLIETAKRSPISGRVVNTLNLVGFGLLVVLMIVVTVHDILKLI